MLDLAAILLVLTAGFSYANHRFLKWPTTIGVMALALALSLGVIGLDACGIAGPREEERAILARISFSEVLMEGMLSILLFAGAFHMNLGNLMRLVRPITALAIVGTALSTLLVGFGCWWLMGVFGVDLPLIYCLLFGALISPTDPIAVLGVLRSAQVPADIEATIAGESLINDGVGVVLFALLLEMLHSGEPPTTSAGVGLFAREALGGVALGTAIGTLINAVLRSIDDYQVEVLITLATVVGGYALAQALETSGPLAMVTIGLLIGNEGRAYSMSNLTRKNVDLFWQMLDEILNSVLFVLIGLQCTVVDVPAGSLRVIVPVVILALAARFLVAGLPVLLWPTWFSLPKSAGWLLTWCGLRGGISVALALALPPGEQRDCVLMLTYSVVVFSILVQGLSVGWLARRLGLAGH